jgi:hypothetical protein
MYPSESLQGIIEPEHLWWEEYKGDEYKRGRLIWAFLPHVDQKPATLIPVERGEDPTQHKIIKARIEPLNIREVIRYPDLPIAALPQRENEIRTVYLGKRRPALIISRGGSRVADSLTRNRAKWQTNPTVIVAPYYGAEKGIKRTGFNPEFVERIRLCEYPQFMWDMLPIEGSTKESIMRLDHMQPVGKSRDSIEFTNYCLGDRALLLLDEWIEWIITGNLDKDTKLCEIRDVLLDL